jgi:hypothetical protein
MSRTYLKIKIKSLAAEARIIRREELRFPGQHTTRTGLYLHRINAVRTEARAALLAYGFLRGRSYAALEAKCHIAPDQERTLRLINKYRDTDQPLLTAEQLAAWLDGDAPALAKRAA